MARTASIITEHVAVVDGEKGFAVMNPAFHLSKGGATTSLWATSQYTEEQLCENGL
jgi:hypothetical protein